MSAGGAKESFAAPRLARCDFAPTASGRGYLLPPLRGSIRTRLRRDITLKLQKLFWTVLPR